MHRIVVGLFALVLAGPAFAQDRAPSDPAGKAARVGALLSNPLVQDTIAVTVDQFADALLQTRVGPLAHYTDPHDAIRPDDTLGDLVARKDPNYRRDLHDSTSGAVATAGRTAKDLASLSTELRATTQRMRRVLDRTKAEIDAAR